ncbi:DUF445 domain-containing protein [Thalassobacillus hwangdonensis]|uniref:DUF445 domain-containing protein n=1 Tax=Thalassobacillus hwangdonensis TaxID=546108 RepID=A0ABW3L4P2_9BACI
MQYKQQANVAFWIVFAIFIGSLILKFNFPEPVMVKMLLFVSEAALVGAIADWFAVRALFTKPLGIGFHTNLISRNREKVIDSVSDMVEHEFLNMDSVKKLLGKVNIVSSILTWLDKNRAQVSVSPFLSNYARKSIEQMDRRKVAAYLETVLKNNSGKWGISQPLHHLMKEAMKSGQVDKWLDVLIDELQVMCEKRSTRDAIYALLEEQVEEFQGSGGFFKRLFKRGAVKLGRSTDSLNTSAAADAAQEELIELLSDLKDPDHELRKRLHRMIWNVVKNIGRRKSWQAAIEGWKDGIIDRMQFQDTIEALLDAMIQFGFETDEKGAMRGSSVVDWLESQVERFIDRLKQDEEMQEWLDDYVKQAAIQVIESEKYIVGEIAEQALKKLDGDALNQFIYDKVADDLEWIRINGSIVGAIAGALIFTLTNLFYAPLL